MLSPYDSKDVAAYIAQRCDARKISYNNTKIQKLLYCLYGVYFAVTGERVCKEYPRAWKYGPVFPSVFAYIHKGLDISKYSTLIEEKEAKDSDIRMAVEEVLNGFGNLTAGQLSLWSHQKGSPWDLAVNGNIDNEPSGLHGFIPLEYIKDYFKDKVLAHE